MFMTRKKKGNDHTRKTMFILLRQHAYFLSIPMQENPDEMQAALSASRRRQLFP